MGCVISRLLIEIVCEGEMNVALFEEKYCLSLSNQSGRVSNTCVYISRLGKVKLITPPVNRAHFLKYIADKVLHIRSNDLNVVQLHDDYIAIASRVPGRPKPKMKSVLEEIGIEGPYPHGCVIYHLKCDIGMIVK